MRSARAAAEGAAVAPAAATAAPGTAAAATGYGITTRAAHLSRAFTIGERATYWDKQSGQEKAFTTSTNRAYV